MLSLYAGRRKKARKMQGSRKKSREKNHPPGKNARRVVCVWESSAGGLKIPQDDAGQLQHVVPFFQPQGQIGLVAGGKEEAALVLFQAAHRRHLGKVGLGEGEAQAALLLHQLCDAQGGGGSP